jgi:hypothetical protein
VTRIDHLARSTFDVFAIVKRTVDISEQFRSRAEPWAGTGSSAGRCTIALRGAEGRGKKPRAKLHPQLQRQHGYDFEVWDINGWSGREV